jgi:hypothetical protein
MKTNNNSNSNTNSEAVKQYFTQEVYDQVQALSMEDMKNLLKELEGTPTWFAIIKYNQERLLNAQNALITLDPFKDPTAMARYQGVMTGILDLQEGVISLKYAAKRSEDPKNAEEDAKNEAGGAYGKY